MRAILVFFHCSSGAGYAITAYERAFYEMGQALVGEQNVHFAYRQTSVSTSVPVRMIRFDDRTDLYHELGMLKDEIRHFGIDFAFGVDQPVQGRPCYRAMREAGVRTIVSYWGASMSSINRGPKLWAKRLEVALRKGPDHYIFESEAMRRTATHGRGVPRRDTSVVPLGVDVERFMPARARYDLRALGIPEGRKVIFFSGHVGEERKGCDVLVRAAMKLAETRSDFHFLICGDQKPEHTAWLYEILGDHPAREHVTFGGYRGDLAEIMPSCYLGAIASTGWDSFTVSSLEMQASGLPLLVSNLQGLPEAIESGRTGYTFPVGDHAALANHVAALLDNPAQRDEMGRAARARVASDFTLARQTERLVDVCRRVDRAPMQATG